MDKPAGSLVDRIERLLAAWIEEGTLRPGAKAPSIRKLASSQGVSPFTVSQAFDRLVAKGLLEAKARSGFRVCQHDTAPAQAVKSPSFGTAFDHMWQVRSQMSQAQGDLNASTGRLPPEWTDHAYPRKALKSVAASLGAGYCRYGEPMGYAPLRQLIARRLEGHGVPAGAGRVLMTHGAMHAMDLIARYLLGPGDPVLVDDPGFYNLFANLRMQGLKLLGVPRKPEGPDLVALDRLCARHAPKLFFTQSGLHMPTGSGISPHVAHGLLTLAGRHGLTIVENDADADLAEGRQGRLAAMDQLERVIYVGSFSKTITPAARVGFVAATDATVESLANVKAITCVSTSSLDEQFIFQVLSEGGYRKHLERLRARLAESHLASAKKMAGLDFTFFCQPLEGKFLWVRHPHIEDSSRLAEAAATERIALAPGKVFRPGLEATPWFRLSVAYGAHPRLLKFFEGFLQGKGERRELAPGHIMDRDGIA
jgi:DNA-binding transcriptional MocR family regulator